jgi:hypothetical protein
MPGEGGLRRLASWQPLLRQQQQPHRGQGLQVQVQAGLPALAPLRLLLHTGQYLWQPLLQLLPGH